MLTEKHEGLKRGAISLFHTLLTGSNTGIPFFVLQTSENWVEDGIQT